MIGIIILNGFLSKLILVDMRDCLKASYGRDIIVNLIRKDFNDENHDMSPGYRRFCQ